MDLKWVVYQRLHGSFLLGCTTNLEAGQVTQTCNLGVPVSPSLPRRCSFGSSLGEKIVWQAKRVSAMEAKYHLACILIASAALLKINLGPSVAWTLARGHTLWGRERVCGRKQAGLSENQDRSFSCHFPFDNFLSDTIIQSLHLSIRLTYTAH